MKKLFVLGMVALVLALTCTMALAEDVTGTVEKGEKGLCIKAASGNVAVAACKCEKAMPDMCAVCKLGTLAGKKVKVTGTVEEKDGVKTITVTAVEECKAE